MITCVLFERHGNMETQRRLFLIAAFSMFCFSAIIAQGTPKAIDMFSAVGLLDKPLPTGVTKRTHNGRPSFHFGSQVPNLIAYNVYAQVNTLMHESHNFQVSAIVKLDTNAKQVPENTLLSISSKNGVTFFKLSLSGEDPGNNLKVKYTVYTTRGTTIGRTIACPRSVHFSDWHTIVVRFEDEENLFRLFVDGTLTAAERFGGEFAAFPSDGQLRLAQTYENLLEGQPGINNRFRGELQDVTIGRGPGCSTALCKCSPSGQKGCVVDGKVYAEGHKWIRDQCNSCRCTHGQTICIYSCPVCKDGGYSYIQGDTWKSSKNNCDDCKCDKGTTTCVPLQCPTPDCTGKSGATAIPVGKCCPVCKEDQCKGTDKVFKACGSPCSKTCQNFQSMPSCLDPCKEGCFCADNKVLQGGACIVPARCDCIHNNKTIKAGQYNYPSNSEMCICLLGKVHCVRFG